MTGTPPRGEVEFTEFVGSASLYLTRTAYLLCGDTETAREAVQETLVCTYAAWRVCRAQAPRSDKVRRPVGVRRSSPGILLGGGFA